jgi:hypothetical protein
MENLVTEKLINLRPTNYKNKGKVKVKLSLCFN